MKDLLEVIEEGREGFKARTVEGNVDYDIANLSRDDMKERLKNTLYTEYTWPETMLELDNNKVLDYLTTHTKAILTNQIERMKGELKSFYPKGFHKSHSMGFNEGYNQAIQTQIDYLESVVKKLN